MPTRFFHQIKSINSKFAAIHSKDKILIFDLIHNLNFDTIHIQNYQNLSSLELSKSGDFLSAGYKDGLLKIWNIESLSLIDSTYVNNTSVSKIKFHPQKNIIAYLDQYLLKIYDFKKKKLIKSISNNSNIQSFSFSNDGNKLSILSGNIELGIWDTRTWIKQNDGIPLNNQHEIFYSPDDKFIITTSRSYGIKVIDNKSFRELVQILPFSQGKAFVIYTPDGFYDGNELGLQYLQYKKGNNYYTVSKNSKQYIPNLMQKIISGEIHQIRKELGVKKEQQKVKLKIPGRTDRAILFAVQDYTEWGVLDNPISDASEIASELQKKYGFEVKVVINPTKREILDSLSSYRKKEYRDSTDQLFVFFSGHGTYLEDTQEGFFIPREGKKDDIYQESYLSYDRLNREINNIPCKHIFLTIDACFSGSFLDINKKGSQGRPGEDENKKKRFLNRAWKEKSRILLASGGKEPTSDGMVHSPLTLKILEFLNSLGFDDYYLEFPDIIPSLKEIEPQPIYGRFGDGHLNGNFLFLEN